MKLSIALAVHNEEKNIIRCLESVYDWTNEIVIVDGESTDNTLSIIKTFDTDNKIRIFNEKHEAMFHKNKQKAIEKCTGNWILQLDADEVVSDQLKKEILEIINPEPQNTKYVAYRIPRLNYFLGIPLKKGGQYPDYTIRLYQNGVAKFPCKSVHEQVEITQNSQNTKYKIQDTHIGHLTADLLHFPYPTFKDYLDKWVRYALLEAEILYKQGTRPSFSNNCKYLWIYPKWWFFKTYIRHLGCKDGFAGFVFSLFSSLRYIVTYCKLYEITHNEARA